MERLSTDVLRELQTVIAAPAVTVYIPMHPTASPPHIAENQAYFKKLLRKAARAVRLQDGRLADRLTEAIDRYHNDKGFWKAQSRGLLVCATATTTRLIQLPVDTEEHVSIDSRFYVAPLIGLLHDHHDFYLLALAQHDPKLYKGTLYGLEPVGLPLPKNIRDALLIDEPNAKTENQGTATGPSMDSGWFNGRGGGRNSQEENRLQFFRMVDQAVMAHTDRSLPLILGTVGAEAAEYRHISKYPHLLEGILPGNHAADNLAVMFEAARHIIRREMVIPEHRAALADYLQISGTNPERVAIGSRHITEAAAQGRVDKLLARMSRKTTDAVRDDLENVLRITFPNDAESKQLNDTILQVCQNSGTVLNMLPDEMPDGTLMAARLRY